VNARTELLQAPNRQGLGTLELIFRHAQERPASPALKDDEESLSYAQFLDRVSASAAGLRALGVGERDRVGLFLPNSVAFVVTALGCMWAGASFVPLSVEEAPARLSHILEDCGPTLVVARDDRHPLLPSSAARKATRIVDLEQISGRAGQGCEIPRRSKSDAYVLYTSGTTGQAKGVRVPERAFRCSIAASAEALGLDETTRAMCVASFHFDGSYAAVFPTLMMGGSVVIPRREELLSVRRFFSAVSEEGITHTGVSPSYLRLLLSSQKLPVLSTSSLRTFTVGGEECIANDIARLWEVSPGLRVFNCYGPTEATIEVTTYEISRDDVASGKVPIGFPHPGVDFHIINEGTVPVTGPNETGELYIGGSQLMRGYWGDAELTAKVLRDDIVPGTTLYKTGDLVWRDDHGRYFYAGRNDDIVKRNGVRISLTEVARGLRASGKVSAAICLLVDHGGRPAIAAFVVASGQLSAEVVRDARSQLPAAMLPDEVFVLTSLPMTPSGKVDRERLLSEVGRSKL